MQTSPQSSQHWQVEWRFHCALDIHCLSHQQVYIVLQALVLFSWKWRKLLGSVSYGAWARLYCAQFSWIIAGCVLIGTTERACLRLKRFPNNARKWPFSIHEKNDTEMSSRHLEALNLSSRHWPPACMLQYYQRIHVYKIRLAYSWLQFEDRMNADWCRVEHAFALGMDSVRLWGKPVLRR